jgi:hypothetical protein
MSNEKHSNKESGGVKRSIGDRGPHALPFATGLIAVLLGVIMLSAPLAGASTPRATSVTLKAPYQGSYYAFGYFDLSGCGNGASFPASPFVNLSTGVFTGGVKATEASCSSANSYTYVEELGDLISNATFTTTTGKHTLTVDFSQKFSLALSAAVSKPGGKSYSFGTVGTEVNLIDETNGTTWFLGDSVNTYYNASTPTTHSYSYKSSISNSSFSYVSGHEYYVVVELFGGVDSVVTAGGTASASLNLYSSGKGITVTSIDLP